MCWVLYLVLGCVLVFCVAMGLMFGIVFAVLCAVGWLNYDAVVRRDYPWFSVPGALIADAWILCLLVKEYRRKQAWREAVSEKIRSQPPSCPLCQGPLEPWSVRFVRDEPTGVHTTPIAPDSPAEVVDAYFRLRCPACNEDAWFTANRGGEIGVHGLWLMIHEFEEERPDGFVIELGQEGSEICDG